MSPCRRLCRICIPPTASASRNEMPHYILAWFTREQLARRSLGFWLEYWVKSKPAVFTREIRGKRAPHLKEQVFKWYPLQKVFHSLNNVQIVTWLSKKIIPCNSQLFSDTKWLSLYCDCYWIREEMHIPTYSHYLSRQNNLRTEFLNYFRVMKYCFEIGMVY